MSTTKLTRRESLTKYAFWLGPVEPTDKEIKLDYKKQCAYPHRKNADADPRKLSLRIRIHDLTELWRAKY